MDNKPQGDLSFLRKLPHKGGKIIAEYIWLGGAGELRAKCRTLDGPVSDVSELPEWNYDGSSCYQATTENSEIIMCALPPNISPSVSEEV